MTPLAHAALAYAGQGFHVFPIIPRQKLPLTPTGFKDATADRPTVTAWWTRWPGANIGCVPGRNGYVVIDVDGPVGDAAAERLGLLAEPTLETITGRPDGGRHRWYRHPGGHIGNADLAPKLNVRADKGYVLLPPSVHPDGPIYRWQGRLEDVATLPPAVIALLTAPRRAARADGRETLGDGFILEGGRNNALTAFAGALRRRGACQAIIAAALQGINRDLVRPPLDDAEVEAIAANIAAYPVPPFTAEPGPGDAADPFRPLGQAPETTRAGFRVQPRPFSWDRR